MEERKYLVYLDILGFKRLAEIIGEERERWSREKSGKNLLM
jgi:hypothetical protein